MTAPTESFRKVFYDLRPAKQVERKMILETLQRLVAAGFPVKDYQYVGMGSIYFVDYVLLHRLLGMRNLLSVEIVSKAERRVLLNKPFQDVAIHMGAIGDVLTKLDRKRPHLIWLDYDHRLLTSDMQDLVLAASVAPESSILVITVDVDPPDSSDKPQDWRDYYEEVAGELLPFGFDIERFARSALGHTTAQILTNAILQGVSGRPSLHYILNRPGIAGDSFP